MTCLLAIKPNFLQTDYIKMRRTAPPEKKFKVVPFCLASLFALVLSFFQGSVFVEFSEKPMADGFLGLPVVKFNDTELIKESKLVIARYR